MQNAQMHYVSAILNHFVPSSGCVCVCVLKEHLLFSRIASIVHVGNTWVSF